MNRKAFRIQDVFFLFFKKFNNLINLLTCGCARSCCCTQTFSGCDELVLLSTCGVPAAHWGGMEQRLQGTQASVVWHEGSVSLCHVGPPWIRD